MLLQMVVFLTHHLPLCFGHTRNSLIYSLLTALAIDKAL
jgi:hypothetical protein